MAGTSEIGLMHAQKTLVAALSQSGIRQRNRSSQIRKEGDSRETKSSLGDSSGLRQGPPRETMPPLGRKADVSIGRGFMNRIQKKKLLLSKWTAVEPTDKERHFLVTRVLSDKQPGLRVVLEATHSKREFILDWNDLKDDSVWRRGWLP
jgi:tryptophan-rich hypothetical protein